MCDSRLQAITAVWRLGADLDVSGERVAAARFVHREVPPRAASYRPANATLAVERGHEDQGHRPSR